MATVEHEFVSITTAQTSTASFYEDVPGAVISSFTAGKKYLLVVNAQLTNSVNTWVGIQVVHGSTAFADSLHTPGLSVANEYSSYGWFTVWTAVSGEGIKVQFRPGSSGTARIDQVTLFSLCLSDALTENSDWLYDEEDADVSVVSSTQSNGGSLTWTPGINNQDWLILGHTQYNFTSASIGIQCNFNEGLDFTNFGVATNLFQSFVDVNFRFSALMARVLTLTNAAHTFVQGSASLGATANTRLFSRLFALNLHKFNEHAFGAASGLLALSATDFATQLQTTSITPSIAGDVWLGGFWAFANNSFTRTAHSRLQVDNTDTPATQTSDLYWFTEYGFASPHRPPINHQSVLSLTSAAHTIDLDGSVNSTTDAPDGRYRCVWAVTLGDQGVLGTLTKTLGALTASAAGTVEAGTGVISGISQTAAITLAWDLSTGATGYKVYIGTATGVYNYPGSPIDVGNVLTYRVQNLPSGTYYFIVKAYNAVGESAASGEVSGAVPVVDSLVLDSLRLVSSTSTSGLILGTLSQTLGALVSTGTAFGSSSGGLSQTLGALTLTAEASSFRGNSATASVGTMTAVGGTLVKYVIVRKT